MKLAKDEFKKLQEHWYEKLYDEGFEDVEEFKNGELVLKKFATQRFYRLNKFHRETRLEYFIILSEVALSEDTIYKNPADKHILIRYAAGAQIKVIVSELKALQTPRARDSVRFIIRRYEMLWGLRNYTNKQLHKKKP